MPYKTTAPTSQFVVLFHADMCKSAGLDPRIVASILRDYTVDQKIGLRRLSRARRTLPMTRTGVRIAAITVGERLDDKAADALLAILTGTAMDCIHYASARTDAVDREVARAAREIDLWWNWDRLIRGEDLTLAGPA